jgi:hypothetical protein
MSRQRLRLPAYLFFLLLILFAIVPAFDASRDDDLLNNGVRTMKYLSYHTDLSFPVYLALFGSAPEYATLLTLMYPPMDDTGYLCTLPTSISEKSMDEASIYLPTVGLLVKYGNCTAQEKANVVLQIQNVYPTVQFLLVYDAMAPNGTYPSEPMTLMPDSPVSQVFNALAILYITSEDAWRVREELDLYRISSKLSPYLSDQFNGSWAFNFAISGLRRPDANSGTSVSVPHTEENSPNFFWFRFVLFGLLIVAPCIRAVYLWYVGGGRIHLRRNENGRIVGLLYVPPIPFWLSIGRLQQPLAPIRETLSEEEFASLPEIKYTQPDPDWTSPGDAQETSPVVRKEPELVDDINRITSLDCQQEGEISVNASFESEAEKGVLGTQEEEVSTENPDSTITAPVIVVGQATDASTYTTCTTCSICIDDFIPGETLTLLPRYVVLVSFI